MAMMSLTKREDYPDSDEHPGLTGKQSPLNLREAPGDHVHGRKTVELARRAGFKALPWQVNEIHAVSAVDENDRWVHSDAVLIASRQNGKSMIVALIVLYRIFILGHNVLFTAQRWETAKELWEHSWKLVQGRKFLLNMVQSKSCSQGRGTIFLKNGGRVVFTTRSQDAGRGLTKVDLIVYDEAYNLTDAEIAALSFLSQAADDPQVFYMTSAVHREFAQHQNGRVISAMRQQALDEWDADEPIYLAEYAASPGLDPEDEDTWREGNPSYGVISNAKKMRSIMKRMSTKVGRINFGVEALGWGSWFNDNVVDDFVPIVDLDRWGALAVDVPVYVGECFLGVEVSPDGESYALSVAGQTLKGVHLQLMPETGRFVVDDVVDVIDDFVARHDPGGIVLDKDSPAGVLIAPLRRIGIEPIAVGGAAVSTSLRVFEQSVADGKLTHDGSKAWMESLSVAEKRGEESRYPSIERYSGNVSALVAGTFALWGLQQFIAEAGSVSKPVEGKKQNPHGALPQFSTRSKGGVLIG
ncbi:hypothetical protein ACTXJY_00260 [Corynebacterium casei]|uniref:hypothetical protein n=1 Tax=Corynebacterium casei TaxID=160386 RepID=UPI003FD61866